jgi:Domain of unknown function (DUF1707)
MTRLPSEDVILSAPMSYAGSAARIMRIRRRASSDRELTAYTVLAVSLVVVAWACVTVWYLMWGVLLIPYRLLRRAARRRKLEAMRHRELMGTIEGSAAGSASAVVLAMAGPQPPAPAPALHSPSQRIGDAERDAAGAELRAHHLAGRLDDEEFEERLGLAQAARTRADLEAVNADLPALDDVDENAAGSRDRGPRRAS